MEKLIETAKKEMQEKLDARFLIATRTLLEKEKKLNKEIKGVNEALAKIKVDLVLLEKGDEDALERIEGCKECCFVTTTGYQTWYYSEGS